MGNCYHQIQSIQTVQNKQKWFQCHLLVSAVYKEMMQLGSWIPNQEMVQTIYKMSRQPCQNGNIETQ